MHRPQPLRTLRIATTFSCLLAVTLMPATRGAAEELRYFRDWLASCEDDGVTSCRASSFRLREGGPQYDQALRIERRTPATPPDLLFESADTPLLPGALLELRVDDHAPTVLMAGGYALGPQGRQLRVTDREAVTRLMPVLRSGNRLHIGYTTSDGETRSVSFSLLGLTAALEFMDDAQAPAMTAGAMPRDFRCLGQEPFWSLEIRGENARLRELGGDPQGRALAGRTRAMGYLAVPTLAWRGRAEGDGGDLVVFITRERCLDTMADRPPYAYAARLSLPDGGARFGCCEARAPAREAAAVPGADRSIPVAQLADKPAQDWSHRLLDLMPVIRLCLERAPAHARTVVTASPQEDGQIQVRLIGERSERFECVIDPASGRIERFAPLSPDSPSLPGEGMPVYLPAGGKPPQAECYDREQVLAPDGALLGYLAYDTCFRAPQDSPRLESTLPVE